MKKNGKYMWTAKVNQKGQIVIPKEAREVFNINEGDDLILFGDIERGIAIAKMDEYAEFAHAIFALGGKGADGDKEGNQND